MPGMVGWQQKDGATSNTRAICVINKIEDNKKIHKIQKWPMIIGWKYLEYPIFDIILYEYIFIVY